MWKEHVGCLGANRRGLGVEVGAGFGGAQCGALFIEGYVRCFAKDFEPICTAKCDLYVFALGNSPWTPGYFE